MTMTRRWQQRQHGSPQRKAAPYVWQAGFEGRPQPHLDGYQSYMSEGFAGNPLIYAAIMYKVRAISSAPLRAYTGDPENPTLLPITAPMSQLIRRPNPGQSWFELQQLQTVYLNLAGNAYLYLDRKSTTKLPDAVWSLRPDRVLIIPQKGGIKGYMYVPEGQSIYDGTPILPENVVHIKFPNPDDPYEGWGYGLSPLQSLARNADVDNMVTKFLHSFFKRGALGMAALEFNTPLDPQTITRLRSEFQEVYGGFEEWGKPIVLDNTGKFRNMTPSFAELGFEAIDKRDESRLLAALGVPGMLIGASNAMSDATFSNFEQADRTFWQNTMIPELRLFEVEYQHYFQNEGKQFVRFDLSDVPALQRDLAQVVESAYKLWQMGTPRDQSFAIVGLNTEGTPGGKTGYIPVNMSPVDEEGQFTSLSSNNPDAGGAGTGVSPEAVPGQLISGATGDKPAPAEPPQPNKQPKKAWEVDVEIKDALTAAAVLRQDQLTRAWEASYRSAAQQAFAADQRMVMAALGVQIASTFRNRSSMDWGAVKTAVALYFAGQAVQTWVSSFRAVFRDSLKAAAQLEADALGKPFDAHGLDTQVEPLVNQFAQQVTDTSNAQIAALLGLAAAQAWSIDTAQNRLNMLFRQYSTGDLDPEDFDWFDGEGVLDRTSIIGITEPIRLYNSAANALYGQWGVTYKQWWTALDERVCGWCDSLHGQIVAVDEVFARKGQVLDVGGKRLTVGYGDVGYPPLHGRCRCCLLPVMDTFGHLMAFAIKSAAVNAA